MPYLYTYTNSETGVIYGISTAQNEQEFPNVGLLPAVLKKHTGAAALEEHEISPELLQVIEESSLLATIRIVTMSADGRLSVVVYVHHSNSLSMLAIERGDITLASISFTRNAVGAIAYLHQELLTMEFALCLEVIDIWNEWQNSMNPPSTLGAILAMVNEDSFEHKQALEDFRQIINSRHRFVGGESL
jgi:hypothetical protein